MSRNNCFADHIYLGSIVRGFARTAILILGVCAAQAHASGWAEVGDRTLRSDIEILAAHGLIANLTTTWPIPDGQLLKGLSDADRLAREPIYVQLAAGRVLAYLHSHGEAHTLKAATESRVTNAPDTIRDFGDTARDKVDIRAGFDWTSDTTHAAFRVGTVTDLKGDNKPILAPDGSYLSTVWQNMQFYGGWVDQWYGPGWTSSMILSNNARPFPKIGFMREDPHAFETPWLSWLGPWQVNFFIGLLDGPRIDPDTALGSFRLSFNPLAGLEVDLTRISEFCGEHHSCNPLKAAFGLHNDDAHPNDSNDEATIEFKYLGTVGKLVVSPYVQFMNEDTGPFTHSDDSYLVGTSLAGPLELGSMQWRLTAEYADSVATLDLFSFGDVSHGVAYNNYSYTDGMRYRDRTLGFSLDSDSHLLSLGGLLIDSNGWTYRLVYYRAQISTPQLAAMQASGSYARNSVSAEPVSINQGEAGLSIPIGPALLDFTVRAQNARVYPGQGGQVSGEAGIRYPF